jgi:NAD-dependent SIR2 family protein deacetylase
MRSQHRPSREDRDLRIERAARTIAAADHLLITAGAGMGVDSGLPDYRGPEGFWNAHPPLRDQRLRWIDLAQPDAFRTMPVASS